MPMTEPLATRPASVATDTLPWYRHKLVWMIIAIPAASVIAGINMIFLAVSSNDGLVVDDYYKQGMAINQSLERDQLARSLGLGAHLTIDESGDVVTLHFDKGQLEDYPATLALNLYFATKTGFDQELQLHRGMNGQYVGYLQDSLRNGLWNVVVTHGSWRLGTRANIQNGIDIDL